MEFFYAYICTNEYKYLITQREFSKLYNGKYHLLDSAQAVSHSNNLKI